MQTSQIPQQSNYTPKTMPVNVSSDNCESVYSRKNVNGSAKVIPIIALLIQVSFIIYATYTWHTNQNVAKELEFKYIYLICIGVPLASIALFPAYFFALYYFRNALFKFIIGTLVFGTGIIITAGLINGEFISVATGALLLGVNLLIIWCFRMKIRLAIVTIKAALIGLKNQVSAIFIKFLPLLLVDALLFGSVVICAIQSIFLTIKNQSFGADYGSFAYVSETTGTILTVLSYFSLFFCGYSIELLGAISYIFGAAFFNQISLKVEQKEENNHSRKVIDYTEITKEASHISFKTSLGTACLGAFIITIVSALRQEAEDGSKGGNNGLGGVLLVCLMSFLEEFIRFLTAQAYVYSAIYGKGLFDSGKMGFETFKTAGFEKYFNYNLTSRILNLMAFLFCLAVGVVMFLGAFFGGAGTLYEENLEKSQEVGASVLYGLMVSLCMFLPFYGVNSIISGNAAAQIAIYVEDPDRLQKTHPETRRFTKYIKA